MHIKPISGRRHTDFLKICEPQMALPAAVSCTELQFYMSIWHWSEYAYLQYNLLMVPRNTYIKFNQDFLILAQIISSTMLTLLMRMLILVTGKLFFQSYNSNESRLVAATLLLEYYTVILIWQFDV